uniref:Uncharacterized protein n=1 Tax=Hucho hucho TaxID=62062 RepID=A0A4W5Q6A7_9TELE
MDSVLRHQPSTLVIDSDGNILESTQPDSPQEVKDSDKSPSSWTPDEVHGFLGHRLGTSATMINSSTMLLESTDSPLEVEHYDESRASWSAEEVHALLTLWADGSVQEQLLSTVRNKRVFTKLSSELAALGSTKTSKQCREKIKKLKQEYKKIKNDTSKNSSNIRGRRWFAIMDAVLTQQTRTSMLLETTQLKSLPEAQDSGPRLTLSSLRLLAPPLRLMSAFLWQVAQQHTVKHYGKLEEFVTLVTEVVPELLSSRQRTQLLLGLRTTLVLELCRNDCTADLVTIQPHLDKIHSLTEFSVHKESNDDELEATESNFVELVQTLLEDPSEREHFFQVRALSGLTCRCLLLVSAFAQDFVINYLFFRRCSQYTTALGMTQHCRYWCGSSSPDWRSCYLYQTSHRRQHGLVQAPLSWRNVDTPHLTLKS